jgi:hypothetical protein
MCLEKWIILTEILRPDLNEGKSKNQKSQVYYNAHINDW